MTTDIDAIAVKNNNRASEAKNSLPRKSKKTIHSIVANASGDADFEIAIVKEFDQEGEPIHTQVSACSSKMKSAGSYQAATALDVFDFTSELMLLAMKRQSTERRNSGDESFEIAIQDLLDQFEKEHVTSYGADGEESMLASRSDTSDSRSGVSRIALVDYIAFRLQSLLHNLHQGKLIVHSDDAGQSQEAKKRLADTLHLVIVTLGHQTRIDEALERSTRRAIYEFAYGLTHEINNPLANIAARAQQLIANVSTENDKRSLATIVDQAMRAHEMLAEMMRVVQPRSISVRSEDVVSILREAAQTQLDAWSNAKIQCDFRLPVKPVYASVDRAALLEAISSIVQNAMQVCRPNDRIEVICHELELGHPDYGDSRPDSLESTRIRIAIRDTGPGMSQDSLDRAWDLYFSGREHGRGLGISLANVRRILEAHKAVVWMKSSPGAGCSVEIRLPKSPDPRQTQKALSI